MTERTEMRNKLEKNLRQIFINLYPSNCAYAKIKLENKLVSIMKKKKLLWLAGKEKFENYFQWGGKRYVRQRNIWMLCQKNISYKSEYKFSIQDSGSFTFVNKKLIDEQFVVKSYCLYTIVKWLLFDWIKKILKTRMDGNGRMMNILSIFFVIKTEKWKESRH